MCQELLSISQTPILFMNIEVFQVKARLSDKCGEIVEEKSESSRNCCFL
jgi:hypothetical protein